MINNLIFTNAIRIAKNEKSTLLQNNFSKMEMYVNRTKRKYLSVARIKRFAFAW